MLRSSTSSATSRRRRGVAGRHPLPSADDFAAAAGRAGIGAGTFVVAYGSLGGAERLWWLLRHFGHDACAVLDLDGWRGPLRAGDEQQEAGRVRAPVERIGDTSSRRRAGRRSSELSDRRRPRSGALARRAEPDRPRPGPDPGSAQRAVERAALPSLPDGRARRLLRFGRDRVRRRSTASTWHGRDGSPLSRLLVGVGAGSGRSPVGALGLGGDVGRVATRTGRGTAPSAAGIFGVARRMKSTGAGGRGRAGSSMCTSCGRRFPLRRLHGAQEVTTFSQVESPPFERGITWSSVSRPPAVPQ